MTLSPNTTQILQGRQHFMSLESDSAEHTHTLRATSRPLETLGRHTTDAPGATFQTPVSRQLIASQLDILHLQANP